MIKCKNYAKIIITIHTKNILNENSYGSIFFDIFTQIVKFSKRDIVCFVSTGKCSSQHDSNP